MTGPPLYSADNPFAQGKYAHDNPFAGEDTSKAFHKEYTSGRLARRMASENAETQAEENPSGATRALGTFAAAMPSFLHAPQAAVSAVANRIPYGSALQQIREAETAAPAYTRIPASVAGDVAQFGPLGKLGKAASVLARGSKIAGAAAMGGSAAALSTLTDPNPDKSLGERTGDLPFNTAMGAGVGIVAPALVGSTTGRTLLGGGLGAYFTPGDIKDKAVGALGGAVAGFKAPEIANYLGRKIPGKIGAALDALSQAGGTRGAVNKEMEGVQRILTPLGGTVGAQGPAAGQAISEAEQFGQKSAAAFAKARADRTVLSDPTTRAMIADPDIRKAFAAAERIRVEAGNPAPQVVTGQVQVPSSILQSSGQPFTTAKDVVESVPDPELLHLTKRIARDVVERGHTAESTIPLEDALRIAPKVEALRQRLHTLSPDYKAADNFFQLGKTAEEGVARGYTALGGAQRNPTARNLTEKTPAAARSWMAALNNADPAQAARLQAAGSRGVQTGARGEALQQVAAKGIERGRAGVLDVPALALSGPAREQRSLLGTPGLEDVLQGVRGETAADVPRKFWLPWKARDAVELLKTPHAMESPQGKRLLSDIIADPQKYQSVLGQYERGTSLLDRLSKILSAQTGSAVGRP